MSFSVRDIETIPAWQQRALQRSLAEIRARSVERLDEFVDAARQLAAETGDSSFTVQQVVRRAGRSLKSFYRYFEGKDGLLLALIEEDSRIGADLLAEFVAEGADPVERLRTYVRGLFTFLALGEQTYVSTLMREQRRLEQQDPGAMATALAPFIDLLERLLAEAEVAGAVLPSDHRRDATVVFNLVLDQIHLLGAGPEPAVADEAAGYVWGFCWHGVGGRG